MAGRPTPGEWTDAQREAAAGIVADALFGEFEPCLRDFEDDLELLLAATRSDLERWDNDVMPQGVNIDEIDGWDESQKLAFIASLVYWLAIDYGVSTGVGEKAAPRMLKATADSPAGLLRRLNDVLNLPPLAMPPR